jgi:glycosidase
VKHLPHRCAALVLAALSVLPLLRAGDAPAPLVSVPRFTHPGAGQVFYFVLTDRFENGSTANDTGGIAGGPDVSGFDPTRISHYHGGDLIGLTSKLDYIKGLGVTAIWITPPFVNKAMQLGTAGYHGYWILDFTRIDPHLGTEADFRDFVAQAHARGLRVYVDIVANHTADVIQYRDGDTSYIDLAQSPYRDADGKEFDPYKVAYNGVGSGDDFPRLSAEVSFPHVPVVPPAEAHAKAPEWLNDVTLYHNRGNSHFTGENSLFGDFVGLDDVFTENPRVVRGFIDAYSRWMERYGIDGYRIDTVKHVNLEFWEAFGTAMRDKARSLGRPDFFEFGEVADHSGDAALVSEFSTTGNLDASLDFAFYDGARAFVSKGGDAGALDESFERDAWFTGHASNAQGATTFVSNHDDGRFGYFIKVDNPGADRARMAKLFLLGQELLLTVRGQPVLYYGDEQGMVGLGNDMGAREDMFPSKSPKFRDLALLGTQRTGADDKFDVDHPFYRALRRLAGLREANPALSRGAMILRRSGQSHVFAFSRIERAERTEYLVALNNSRTDSVSAELATCQPAGAALEVLFDSETQAVGANTPLVAGADGHVAVSLRPLQCVIWRATAPLPVPASPESVRITGPAEGDTLTFATRDVVGQLLTVRHEIGAQVDGGDGFAEVTFALGRASRPGQFELIGTSDSPPYRVFWRPPADLAAGDTLTFIATVDDLRGHRASSQVGGIHVTPDARGFGIRGATVPRFTLQPDAEVKAAPAADVALSASATGTGPLDYTWLHDGRVVAGASLPVLSLEDVSSESAGNYVLLVRNREGTAISRDVHLTVK